MKKNLVMPINIKNTHPESYLNDTVSWEIFSLFSTAANMIEISPGSKTRSWGLFLTVTGQVCRRFFRVLFGRVSLYLNYNLKLLIDEISIMILDHLSMIQDKYFWYQLALLNYRLYDIDYINHCFFFRIRMDPLTS